MKKIKFYRPKPSGEYFYEGVVLRLYVEETLDSWFPILWD